MAVHVAILRSAYLKRVLSGAKTVESRLSRGAGAPFGKVKPGDRLFFKHSGGPFGATALAGQVHSEADATPARIDALGRRFDRTVCGGADYWAAKRGCRYVTLIELARVEPWTIGPAYKPAYLRAWYVLPDDASPLAEWTITPAAVRNGYAMWPDAWPKPEGSIQVETPDGAVFQTDLANGRRLRERGWAKRYAAAGVGPGDVFRWVWPSGADPRSAYRVRYLGSPVNPAVHAPQACAPSTARGRA
ncbi:MAG: hypothetical protein AAF288_01215 [Planctomycetota bacterium]